MVFILFGYFLSSPNWGNFWGNFSEQFLSVAGILIISPAKAGVFVCFLFFSKMGLGKFPSVNYFLGFFELKLVRIMRVHRGGYRAAQTVSRPDTHDFARYATFLATTDKRVSQFVRVSFGQKPLHARGDRVEIGVFCFFKIDE